MNKVKFELCAAMTATMVAVGLQTAFADLETSLYGGALDAPELEWKVGGVDADAWEVVTSPSFDSEDACAAFADGATGIARIATTVTGSGTISFRWRIESGTSFAGIAFMVDGEDAEHCENDLWALFEYAVSGNSTITSLFLLKALSVKLREPA